MADEFSTLGREAIRHALADMFQAMKVTAELQIDRIREEGDMAIALTSSSGSLIVLPTNTTTRLITASCSYCTNRRIIGLPPITYSTTVRANRHS
jgi:hypothetical protein